MAVSSTTVSSGPFTANGVTTVFPFTFAAASASEVAVTLDGVALAPSAYSVIVDDNSGSVTITPALASGSILILSDPDFTQETTFSNQSALLPTVLNKINDRAVIRDLKLQSDTQRALKLPLGSLPVDLSGTGYITISGGTVAVVAGAGTLDPNSLTIVDNKIATAVGGVNTTIAALTTTNIPEGSRQYFTTARAQAAITGSSTATVTNGVVSLTKAQLDVAAGYTVVTVNGGITFNNPIKFAADPSDPLGAATKQYVDARVLNQIPKGSVASATTGNITLSGVQTIDTVTGSVGQRVLVKDQTTPSQNGIYLQATGAWTRTTDMDTWTEVPGATTFVTGGAVNINTGWSSNSSVTGTIDSTAITWTQTSNPGSYTSTGGITKTGTQFSLTPIGAGLVLGNASGTASPAPISIAALLGYTPTSSTALASNTGSNLVGWIAATTGAISRNVRDKLRDVVSVKDFGATGDGATDDTAAIQAAINNGGHVVFPNGDYRVSSALSITKGVTLSGGGGSAVIVSTVAVGNVIAITGPTADSGAARVNIDGLNFGTSVVRTGGSYIEVSNGVYNVTISNCRFDRAWIGVRNTGTPGFGFYLQNLLFYNSVQGSVLIDNSGGGSVGQILSNLNILGPADGSNDSVYGVKVVNAGDLVMRDVQTVKSGKGLWICPTAGARVQLMFVENCYFDSGTDWGIYVSTDGGDVNSLSISGTWSGSSSLGGGMYFAKTANGGFIRDVSVVDCRSSNNAREGFYIGANNVNTTISLSKASNNLLDGVLVEAATTKFQIIGNTFGPYGEFTNGNGGAGIRVTAGASNNYIITNNFVFGNTGTNIVDGGTGTTKFIAQNI